MAILEPAFSGCGSPRRTRKFASLIAEIVQLVSLHAKTS
jgi:hypothetical protein